MLRFDHLRYASTRTVREQVEYDALLERVIKGEDGVSEFPTEPTSIMEAMLQHDLCVSIAKRTCDDLKLYGPRIAEIVVPMIIAGLK